mmetsp:Transcript_30738/g.64343  ORF Transcript_30738/g.64343 Transcript_30738/m.64343 type:complete len:141 (-) Transcript_30738:466-888(-)
MGDNLQPLSCYDVWVQDKIKQCTLSGQRHLPQNQLITDVPDYVFFKEYVSNEINKLPQYDVLYSAIQPRVEPDYQSVVGVGLLIQRQCRPPLSSTAVSVSGWLSLDGWVETQSQPFIPATIFFQPHPSAPYRTRGRASSA